MPNKEHIIYLASPYSSDNPTVCRTRQTAINMVTGHMIEAGHIIFSPLTYSATLKRAGFTFAEAEQWYRFDRQLMHICDELVVAMLPGWEESKGVNIEIKHANRLDLPISYNRPGWQEDVAMKYDQLHDIDPDPPEPIIYLAAPYTHDDPTVTRKRVQAATRHAISDIIDGEIVFSPVSYTETIQDMGFRPNPENDWYAFDIAFMNRCQELRVLQLPGWRESHGVTLEINTAEELNIPIRYTNPDRKPQRSKRTATKP